ncbi:MAG: leucyl aminopeptidase family protein [Rudaea sp.]
MQGLKQAVRGKQGIRIIAVDASCLARVARSLGKEGARWLDTMGFNASAGKFVLVPDAKGHFDAVLIGVSNADDMYALSPLPQNLPRGDYRLDDAGIALNPARAAFGWALGAYRFTRYRAPAREPANLLIDADTLSVVTPLIDATRRVRDLVNTPTEDMGPEHLAAEIKTLAKSSGATFREFVGDQLLKSNFPTIHAVGRASHRAPRLVEMNWGKEKHPRIVIVGKGVCFDTGGLDIKSSDGMRWMKKDMGGAAHAIALAGLIVSAKLPVRLTLLVPAVENSIAGNSYRPGEVIRTRAGITVEVDNTDAEGRLVLCDALAYAVENQPDLIVDFATLTGAARVALGPDLPALFTNNDALAHAAAELAQREQDPVWRMPLWQPYLGMLDSRIADTVNAGPSRMAGAITAALFLQRFVPDKTPWMHVDTYSWNDADRPGRPAGGEAQSLRTVFALLSERYAPRQDRPTRKA